MIKQARHAPLSATGTETSECKWDVAQEASQKLFLPISKALEDDGTEVCARFWKDPDSARFYAAMPQTCFLTARKFPKESMAAMLRLFKGGCQDGVAMISGVRCETEAAAGVMWKRATGWLGSAFG